MHYEKIYFLDLITHTPQEVQANILKLNKHRDHLMIRHFKPEHLPVVKEILSKNSLNTISHFKNNIKCNVIHLASAKNKRIAAKNSISFHRSYDFLRLQKFHPDFIFLSPVFETKTHPKAKPLGKIAAFKMGFEIKKQMPKCKIYLLGGVNEKGFSQIKKLDFTNIFSGYGFIRGR
jgi:hypothetical protein